MAVAATTTARLSHQAMVSASVAKKYMCMSICQALPENR